MSGPYIGSGDFGPLYRNPFLTGPNLYGKSRFPLDYLREKPVDYRLNNCPNGELIMKNGVNIQMSPNFSENDVSDITEAIRKVAYAKFV